MSRVCQITGRRTRRGNSIARRGLAKPKGGIGLKTTGVTRRTFKPNIQTKKIWVEELGCMVRVKLSAKALKTITTVVPQLRVLTTVVGVSADMAVTVGEATVEVEMIDSITGERMAAAVDARAGKKAFSQLTKWSDFKEACDFWAFRLRRFLGRQVVDTRS